MRIDELRNLDAAMNNLLADYDYYDASEEEVFFLKNIAYDIVEILLEHDDCGEILDLVKRSGK